MGRKYSLGGSWFSGQRKYWLRGIRVRSREYGLEGIKVNQVGFRGRE